MRSWRAVDESTVRTMDALIGVWVVVWLFLAGWTAVSVWSLSDLGPTMMAAGQSLDTAGSALQQIGQVPVVGTAPGELGDQVRATAERVTANGASISGEMRRLAVLLGLSTFFIPVTPVLGLWAPLRLDRRRETRQLEGALRSHRDEPGLQRYLAHRAVERLPWAELAQVSTDPYAELSEGRWERLADRELQRMGIATPRWGVHPGPGPR